LAFSFFMPPLRKAGAASPHLFYVVQYWGSRHRGRKIEQKRLKPCKARLQALFSVSMISARARDMRKALKIVL
jgi:hypothetical protein